MLTVVRGFLLAILSFSLAQTVYAQNYRTGRGALIPIDPALIDDGLGGGSGGSSDWEEFCAKPFGPRLIECVKVSTISAWEEGFDSDKIVPMMFADCEDSFFRCCCYFWMWPGHFVQLGSTALVSELTGHAKNDEEE